MVRHKYDLYSLRSIREEWDPDAVNSGLMNDRQRARFETRKNAVDMYIDGYKLVEITRATGIHLDEIYRYLDRACETDPVTGTYFGYRGLVPGKRIRKYTRSELSATTAGRFGQLLVDHPGAEDFLLSNYFNKSKGNIEHNMSVRSLHGSFLTWLQEQNVTDDEYPFNTKDQGYKSLSLFLKDAADKHIYSAADRLNDNAKQKMRSTGQGEVITYQPYAPYQCFQLDGHRLDTVYVVELTDPQTGELIRDIAERPWLVLAIDVATRAVVGYSITQEGGYDSIDVLNAYKNAILPKQLIELTLPGLKYPEEGAFPDIAIPDLQYSLPCVLYMDNDSSHLSELSRSKLLGVLDCTLAYGAVTTPETRGIIERFFKKMEEKGLHRLPSTTGSNKDDPKRKESEKNAKKYNITMDVVEQVVAWSIAQLNNEPHTALSGATPISIMKARVEKGGMWPVQATKEQISEIEKLSHRYVDCVIRGSRSSGKRPYVQYKYVEYRSPILSNDLSLIGTKAVIEVDPEDIRFLKLYRADSGVLIDTIRATGRWAYIPHTLQIREWAHDFDKEYKKKYGHSCPDPIKYLLQDLLEKSKKSSHARTQATIIIKASGGLLDESQETKAQKYEIVTSDKSKKALKEDDINEEQNMDADLISLDVSSVTDDQLKAIDYKLLTEKQRSDLLKRLGVDKFYSIFGSQMA